MDLMSFIIEKSLVLIPVLLVIGKILKESNLNDKYIPLVLLVFGIAGSIAIMGFSVQAIIQGILVTGAAVYGNQVFKQLDK